LSLPIFSPPLFVPLFLPPLAPGLEFASFVMSRLFFLSPPPDWVWAFERLSSPWAALSFIGVLKRTLDFLSSLGLT